MIWSGSEVSEQGGVALSVILYLRRRRGEVVAEWEVEAGAQCRVWEETAAREAAAREEAIATPDGRAADGQSKIFDPGKP